MEKKESKDRGYGSIIVPLVLLGLVYFFLSPYRIFELPTEMSLAFLGLPLMGLLSIITVEEIIKTLFSGSFVPPLSDCLVRLALGVFAFFLLRNLNSPEALSAAMPVFLIFALFSGYRVISYFLKEDYPPSVISKSFAFVASGIILKHLFSSLIPEARTNLSSSSSLSSTKILLIFFREVLPMGIVIGGAAISLYALKKSDNDYFSVIGSWVEAHVMGIGFFGGVTWVYIFSAREQLIASFGQELLVAEWGIVGLFAFATYIMMRGSVKGMAEREQFRSWEKHAQKIGSSGDPDQARVAEMIEEFIEEGKKERIITYLIRLSERRGYRQRFISNMMGELINYREEELPPLVLSWEAERIKEKNREKRKEVLENVLERAGVKKE